MELIRVKTFAGNVVDAYQIDNDNVIYYEEDYKTIWLVGIDEHNHQDKAAIMLSEGREIESIPHELEQVLKRMKKMTLLEYVLKEFDRREDISIF